MVHHYDRRFDKCSRRDDGKALIESDRVEEHRRSTTDGKIDLGSIKSAYDRQDDGSSRLHGHVVRWVRWASGLTSNTIPWNKFDHRQQPRWIPAIHHRRSASRRAHLFIVILVITTGQIGSASASLGMTTGARRIIGGRECGRI